MSEDYNKRVRDIVSPEDLKSKHVLIVGVGSGGGVVADDFARLGIRTTIVDLPDERLETHNIIRHILGAEYLGEVKVDAMATYLRRVNPDAQVVAVRLDVVESRDDFDSLVSNSKPDLIVVCTDSEASKFAVDAVARKNGIPVVGGGVYDGGAGGEVYRVIPGGACYGCIFDQVQGADRRPERMKRTINYDNPNVSELRSTAALRVDITQISLFVIRMALQVLFPSRDSGIPDQANVIIFPNRRVAGIFDAPFRARFLQVCPSSDCLDCCEAKVREACMGQSIGEVLKGLGLSDENLDAEIKDRADYPSS